MMRPMSGNTQFSERHSYSGQISNTKRSVPPTYQRLCVRILQNSGFLTFLWFEHEKHIFLTSEFPSEWENRCDVVYMKL